ncbi:response regulator transcription factor [Catenulispora subtropica]|uniref:Sensory transduction protein RegX3 n=2 Tax=Catenulispora subtropica TaxID=450798 RepID=A0ABP5ETH9_9ACTN
MVSRASDSGAMRVLITGLGRRRSRTLNGGLAALGFDVLDAADVTGAGPLRRLPDVVLLECGIVDREVLAFCRRLRSELQAPIIAVTHRVDLGAWLRGHDNGIDDYVVQPFGLQELAARLRLAVAPPRPPLTPGPPRRITAGPLVVSEDSRTVTVHGQRVALRPKEYQLLVVLARQAGTVLARDQLIARLWPAGWDGAERSLEVHVASLRSKLALPGMIATVRGVGYRLVTPESFLRLNPDTVRLLREDAAEREREAAAA